jgi:hypothetical protein
MILGSLPSKSVGDTRKATSYLVGGAQRADLFVSGPRSPGGV